VSVAFEELRAQAQARWAGMVNGRGPWVRVGYGTSGQAAGADAVFDAVREAIGESGVNATVTRVGSLGLCFAEPLVDVSLPGGERVFYANVTPERARDIVGKHVAGGRPIPEWAFAWEGNGAGGGEALAGVQRLAETEGMRFQKRMVLRNAGSIDPHDILQYVANDGYAALDRALETMEPQQVLEDVKASGLRGRGGAAFPTGVKWSFLAPSEAPLKYVLCNCEEGDPGAFNDKGILESDPHTLVEGVILAGYATGSSNGFIFIRQGHGIPINAARHAVQQAYDNGLLGRNILGSEFSYDIEVALTGDSYVAGEETALMEAIEGKRAQPRFRPPFPAAHGVWGRPSNINNVKTLSYVPTIIREGAEAFKAVGTESSAGTAVLCISGHVKRPGMYEVPMGLTLRQAIEDIAGGAPGGRGVKVLQTGGPLGGVLGEEAFDVQIDFDAMSQAGAILGSGGIIVGDEDVDIVDLLRNMVAFNQFESCGKCYPCRLGTTHMLEILDRICRNEGREGDLELLERIGETMRVGSLCGHGQLGYGPVSSALRFFEDEIRSRLRGELQPSGAFGDGSMIAPVRTLPS